MTSLQEHETATPLLNTAFSQLTTHTPRDCKVQHSSLHNSDNYVCRDTTTTPAADSLHMEPVHSLSCTHTARSNSTLLSMKAALELTNTIENDSKISRSLNSRNLIRTERRESPSVLSEIFEILFQSNDAGDRKATPTLSIKATIPGVDTSVNCYLDTGSNYSCISSKLTKGLPLKTSNLPNIIAANNNPLHVIGRIDLPIYI